jgi:hypothetical protein
MKKFKKYIYCLLILFFPLTDIQAQELASPEEINLDGNIRIENMVSPLGSISLKWPRKVESLFGRTPERAVADAARTVNRALNRPGFSPKVQNLSLDWQIVFMDEDLPETQIPAYLVSNCHPAWMTPPANIYVVAQRVAEGCGNTKKASTFVADSELAEVLIHEMGHAVEFRLLGPAFRRERFRAEGFATWFEQFASDLSSTIPRGAVKKRHDKFAREAIKYSPDIFTFQGTAHDYARASLYFRAIVERRRLSSLMDVYEVMSNENIHFFSAVEKKLGWDRKRIESEVLRVIPEY